MEVAVNHDVIDITVTVNAPDKSRITGPLCINMLALFKEVVSVGNLQDGENEIQADYYSGETCARYSGLSEQKSSGRCPKPYENILSGDT